MLKSISSQQLYQHFSTNRDLNNQIVNPQPTIEHPSTEKGGTAQRKKGEQKRYPYLVLDTLDAVEDDAAVPTLDVVQAVHGGVHGGAANYRDLRQRAGPRWRNRNPAAALDVHLRRAAWERRGLRRRWRE
jgi:hypothetical protein